MNQTSFESIRTAFQEADVEGKIDIYVSTEDLTQEQYKELLRFYPYSELNKLEKALEA